MIFKRKIERVRISKRGKTGEPLCSAISLRNIGHLLVWKILKVFTHSLSKVFENCYGTTVVQKAHYRFFSFNYSLLKIAYNLLVDFEVLATLLSL